MVKLIEPEESNPYQIKTIILESGERLPVLVDKKTSLPIPIANHFMFHRRPVCEYRTLVKELNVFSYFMNWAKKVNIDVQEIIESGNGLSFEQIFSLFEYLRKSFSKNTNSSEWVTASTHMFRVDVVRKFLKYYIETVLSKIKSSDPRFDRVKTHRDLMMSKFKSLSYTAKTKGRESLNENLQKRLLTIIEEDSEENPWIKRDRMRNKLLIHILLKLGLRLSEALKIRLEDVVTYGEGPIITIKRRPDDKDDSRISEPRVKTLGRIHPITSDLTVLIEKYLKERRTVKGAKKHPFLFVSNTTGKPLSIRGTQRIFDSICEKVEEFSKPGLFSAHVLRHTWNYNFMKVVAAKKIDQANATKIQNYLCGWAPNSTSGARYASTWIKEEARKIQLDLMEMNYELDKENYQISKG